MCISQANYYERMLNSTERQAETAVFVLNRDKIYWNYSDKKFPTNFLDLFVHFIHVKFILFNRYS